MRPRKFLSGFLAVLCAVTYILTPVNAENISDTEMTEYNILDIIYNENDNNVTYDSLGRVVYKDTKTTDDGLRYIIRNDNVIIVDCKEDISPNVVIPDKIEGFPVTAIGDRAFTFKYCTSYRLESIILPDTLISIGDEAFKQSYYMTEMTIPKNVKYIGQGINSCSPLFTDIKVAEDNPYFTSENGILYSRNMKTIVEYPCGRKEKEYTIPESVTAIHDGAFYGCESLEEINIPSGVDKIGKWAFSGCVSLKNFIIPEGITNISASMLRNCKSLTEIKLPDAVKKIDDHAFAYCGLLTDINIPDGVTSIGKCAFYECSSLERIEFPDSVESFGGGKTFYRCRSLSELKLPSNLTEIPGEMCAGCGSLEHITIPQTVKTIKSAAFSGSALKSVSIPDSVEVIEYAAFQGCSKLETVNVSDEHVFTHIGDCAFGYGTAGSTFLTNWYNNQLDGPIYIGKSLYSYKGVIPKGETVKVKEGTVTIASTAFGGQENLTDIYLPDTVKYINDRVFMDCGNLKNITLPKNLETIENISFVGTALEEITLPASLKSVGPSTFYELDSLKKVVIYSRDCVLSPKPYSQDSLFPQTTVIYGYTGSTAEEYAKDLDRTFIPLDISKTISFVDYDTGEYIDNINAKFIRQECAKQPSKYVFTGEPEVLEEWNTSDFDTYVTQSYDKSENYAYSIVVDTLPENCYSNGSKNIRENFYFDQIYDDDIVIKIKRTKKLPYDMDKEFIGKTALIGESITAWPGYEAELKLYVNTCGEKIGGMEFKINYDEALELADVRAGDGFSEKPVINKETGEYILALPDNVTAIENDPYEPIAVCTFKIPHSAADGDKFTVNFTGIDGSPDISCLKAKAETEGDDVYCKVYTKPAEITVTVPVNIVPPDDGVPPMYNSFDYNGKYEFIAALDNDFGKEFHDTAQEYDYLTDEQLQKFDRFLSNTENGIYIPCLNGVDPYNISMYPSDLYNETNVYYSFGIEETGIQYISMMYIDSELIAPAERNGILWLLNQIDPNGKDSDKSYPLYSSYEEYECNIGGKDYKAAKNSFENDPRVHIVFLYENMLVRIVGYEDVMADNSSLEKLSFDYRRRVIASDTTEPTTSAGAAVNTETTTAVKPIKGDVTGNGKIDLYDAIEIAKSILGTRKFTEEERETADFNGDGKIDLYDAIEVAKYLIQSAQN